MAESSDKWSKLKARMNEYAKEDIIVAFSGGVDSSLLLKLACDMAAVNGTRVYAVTAQTRLHPKGDLASAKETAGEMGACHVVISIDELEEAHIEKNPADRCYRCKKSIFLKICKLAKEKGVRHILDGTNGDDLKEYRPGIRALKELGIESPLSEYEITKKEIREFAKELNISAAERPASPCLATRLPYGSLITYQQLDKIEEGETCIRTLGFYNVRLRVHGNIARIEVDRADIPVLIEKKEKIITQLKKLGFTYITVDLEGFRSGSMDVEVL